MRRLLRIHVFEDGDIGRRTDDAEQEQHIVAFHEPAGLLDRLRRRIGVVVGDHPDLAAVDAAMLVEAREIALEHLGVDGIDGGRTAVGDDIADDDLLVARALIVLRRKRQAAARQQERARGRKDDPSHVFPPFCLA